MGTRRVLLAAVVATALGGCVDPIALGQTMAGLPADTQGRNAPVDQFTDYYWCQQVGRPKVIANDRKPCEEGFRRVPYTVYKRYADAVGRGTNYCYDPAYRVAYTLEAEPCRGTDRELTKTEYENR